MNTLSIPKKLLFLIGFATIGGCGGGDGNYAAQAASGAATPVFSPQTTLLSSNLKNGSEQWESGSAPTGGKGTPVDGVNCLVNETYHIHTQLTIIRDGELLAIPPNIGLQGCAYELHTHDRSGVLHVETNMAKRFTLGQFFSVWGQPLNATNIAGLGVPKLAVYIRDGATLSPYSGDIRAIELQPHRVIYLVIGNSPASLPDYRWDSSW